MGTKNCPETPRQKMINMMYIVLTAMLAINVAAEVLEAFRVVDASLMQTLRAVDMKNAQVYSAFNQAYAENPAKVQEWKDKADQIKTKTDSLISYIWQLKEKLVVSSGSKTVTPDNPAGNDRFTFVTEKGDTLIIRKEDDINTPSEIMITQKKADELKQKIIAYKEFVVSMIPEDDLQLRENILQELKTEDPPINLREGGEKRSWEIQHFDSKPLAAILTLLSKMQIDVKNSEANVVNYFYSQIDAASYKFNKLGAQVIANSGIVLQGDEYLAEVFLAAIDTTEQPEILVNNQPLNIVDGKGVYRVKTTQPGTFKWSGLIKYKTPEGTYRNYPFTQEYQVTPPSVTISPTKMNVFYQGIPNPVDVSVPSVPKENLRVDLSNGRIERSGNAFMVYPKDLDEMGRKTTVTVYATVGGVERSMGSMTFRVKKVPDPVAQIGGMAGGNLRKENLLVEDGVVAVLEDFLFDLKFTVTQFDVSITGSGGFVNTWKSTNNRFTAEQKTQFKNLAVGSIIYIDNIKAKGDDGSTRDLNPISFKIR